MKDDEKQNLIFPNDELDYGVYEFDKYMCCIYDANFEDIHEMFATEEEFLQNGRQNGWNCLHIDEMFEIPK